MKNGVSFSLLGLVIILLSQCVQKRATELQSEASETQKETSYGGFESQIEWGEHLVIIGLCNDCHTPKKMSPAGLVLDTALWLSGHQAEMPEIDFDRNVLGDKNLIIRSALTREWIGPWGVSYAANLTPDETGIGNWTEEQFFKALREGKYKGLAGSRTLLPPMPWEMYKHMTDDEIRAIFAYLRSIKPISNLVPPSIPAPNFLK